MPEPILRCRLMGQGGFQAFEGLPDRATHRRLLDEAVALAPTAQDNRVVTQEPEEFRGGSPPRKFLSSSGGEAQSAFYHSPEMAELLGHLTGMGLRPSGPSGTYTYYVRPGDHLSLHRDVDICEVAVITCLLHQTGSQGQGGRLDVYPGRVLEPLSQIRKSPDRGRLQVDLLPGQTLLMLGGYLPHAVTPVGPGQERIVSVLCYR